MTKIKREDIQIITRHSNWSKKGIDDVLKKEIYHDKESWHKFLKLLFISLGISFTTAGIIFFFAYNWIDLHKFIKIGLIELLIISLILTVAFAKIRIEIKNILLTSSSVLVGVLFAVFGQIYQTGANAYDFFLGWTIFITIWVLISNFAPLWLLFITLINTTFILYSQQVAHDWSEVFIFTSLFNINLLLLIIFKIIKEVNKKVRVPLWFSNIIALATISFSTIGIIIGIFEDNETSFVVLVSITLIIYVIGIIYGLKSKNSFYLSIVSFSTIIIISSLLIKSSSDPATYFFLCLFIIGSVTFVIKKLIDLQKKWIN